MYTKCLAILCAVATLITAPSVSDAQSKPTVTVVNTASNPVPVTGSVTVGNAVIPVEVSNADPIPVSVSSGPAVQPIHDTVSSSLEDGEFGVFKIAYTVPAGKRLVIEFISFQSRIPIGQRPEPFGLNTKVGGETGFYVFPVSFAFEDTNIGLDTYVASSPTRIYCDPGQSLIFRLGRTANDGTASAFFTFSGYLENVP